MILFGLVNLLYGQLAICLLRTNGFWAFDGHGMLLHAGWIAELAALH